MPDDFYKTLGVSRDASQADIQKAYRDLARKYHPDLHPDDKGAKKKFQEVQAAFDVLNDSTKREQYDRYGSSFESMGAGGARGAPWQNWSNASGAPGAGGGGQPGFEDVDFGQFFGERFGSDSGSTFGDIFSQFRGAKEGRTRRGGAKAPKRGADLQTDLEIPLTTAVLGGQAQISLRRQSGELETITVKIPVGIEDGKKIRLRGQGEASGTQGSAGDILITIHVEPHPFFQRRGNHLDVKVPVTLAEAALGAKIDLPTPQGKIVLRIPPGTSSGQKLRVKGRGVAPKGAEPGDLFAEIQIVLPTPLDDTCRELFKQLDEHAQAAHPQQPRRDLHW